MKLGEILSVRDTASSMLTGQRDVKIYRRRSPGTFEGMDANTITSPQWQFVEGTPRSDGRQINGSNGTYWTGCDNGEEVAAVAVTGIAVGTSKAFGIAMAIVPMLA